MKYSTHFHGSTIEEYVGNYTEDATNMANIENDHKDVYGLKLPIGYFSSPTKLAEIYRNVSRQHAVRPVHKCHMRLLEGEAYTAIFAFD